MIAWTRIVAAACVVVCFCERAGWIDAGGALFPALLAGVFAIFLDLHLRTAQRLAALEEQLGLATRKPEQASRVDRATS